MVSVVIDAPVVVAEAATAVTQQIASLRGRPSVTAELMSISISG